MRGENDSKQSDEFQAIGQDQDQDFAKRHVSSRKHVLKHDAE